MGDNQVALPEVAGDLALYVSPLPARTSCGAVYETLVADVQCPAYAVVDEGGRPVGLVNRLTFLSRYAQRFIPELFHEKPVVHLMDDRPLIVEEDVPIVEVGRQVAIERPDALLSGFIISGDGRYKGMGTGQALIRCKVQRDSLRTVELQQAVTEAARARRAMSQFLAMMSHELRTPLNAIIGFSDILRHQQFGPVGQARYLEYAHHIHDSGNHLLSVISDILDLSKAEAGRLDLQATMLNLCSLVDSCVRLVSQHADAGRVTVRTDIPADLPRLSADELKVKQVILNLLTNAIKFTPPGGTVVVRAGLAGGEMSIVIEDDGIGIAAKDMPLALAPFGQIDSSLARKSQGTGLGLPLVRVLMELHGGRFTLASEPNIGTTATVVFPRERVLSAVEPAAAVSAAAVAEA